jgi:inorganic pyrophosphatase
MKAMPDVLSLAPREGDSGLVTVVVETPGGSRNKYKYDEKLHLFRLDKILPLGASFPFDFGFIPSTRAEDGDPVDVLVLMDEPTFPGCLLSVHILGVLQAEQTEKGETFRNDRVLAVPVTKHNSPEWQSLEEVPAGWLDQIEHFFVSYNRTEDRPFRILGRSGPDVAERLIQDGIEQFQTRSEKET